MSNIIDRMKAFVGVTPPEVVSAVSPVSEDRRVRGFSRYVASLSFLLAACSGSAANPLADNSPKIIHENQNNDSVLFFKYGMNQPGQTQFLRFKLTTRNHWTVNPGSHFAVVLQGAWLLDTPGIRGVGIALGNMGSCIGLSAENFNNPTSFLIPGTCQPVPLLDNETYNIEVKATATLLIYTVAVAGQIFQNSVPIDTTAFGPQRSWASAVVFNPNNSTIEVRDLAWGWE
jgi:hypothetical protein